MNQSDIIKTTFQIFKDLCLDKYKKDWSKIRVYHKASFGDGKVYTIFLKTISMDNTKKDNVMFFFEIKKENSFPIEFVSENIETWIEACRKIVLNDEFVEIIKTDVNESEYFRMNKILRLVLGMIWGTLMFFSILYLVLGIFSLWGIWGKIPSVIQFTVLLLSVIMSFTWGIIWSLNKSYPLKITKK